MSEQGVGYWKPDPKALVSEVFRICGENDALKRRVSELEKALDAALPYVIADAKPLLIEEIERSRTTEAP